MNPTIEKFGYPDTLLRDFRHWVVLVRQSQVTLGSLVLAAKGDATEFSALPVEAFSELHEVVVSCEAALSTFTHFEKINYLMLMMVDPNVHFHVFPRYSEPRSWNGLEFADAGWPGPPALKSAIDLTDAQIGEMVTDLTTNFR